MRKGCLVAAIAAGLVAGVAGRCSANDWGFPGAAGGCPSCGYPPWAWNPGGPCLHIGWYGCAPPSNYHPITWSQSPADSARMVRMQLANMGIFPPPVIRPEPRELAPPPKPVEKKVEKSKTDAPKLEDLPSPKKNPE